MRIYWLSSVILIQLLILVLIRICILTSWGRSAAFIAISIRRRRIPVISSNSLIVFVDSWLTQQSGVYSYVDVYMSMPQHFRFLNLIGTLMRIATRWKSHEYLSLSSIDSRWFFSHQSLLFSRKSPDAIPSFARRCRTKTKQEYPLTFTFLEKVFD